MYVCMYVNILYILTTEETKGIYNFETDMLMKYFSTGKNGTKNAVTRNP
jgi:hypothetical protein